MIKRRLPEIVLILMGVAVVLAIAYSPSAETVNEKPEKKEKVIKARHDSLYGIVVDSLEVDTYQIQARQHLSDILTGFNVDMTTIDRLARKSKSVFDVRKMRAGNNYSVLSSKDSLETLQYFVYEKNSTDYVVYDLRDSVRIYEGEKKVRKEMNQVSGRINTSLWMSMKNAGVNPFLAIKLSEIYAWVIDFYAIEDGDSYKVIYEKLYVDGEPIGLGRIHATRFDHASRQFYAYYFVQDTLGDYFDDEANSLRREFLKAPLRYSRISSGFSHSRMHPILRIRRPHRGVDYAAPRGTPVQAVGDGKIIKAQYSGGAGNYVKIRHNGTYSTAYMHLSKYGEGIKTGKYVKQGDVIGYVGSTGLSTGPHLDFRFYKNGDAVNPLKVESPPAEPVDSTHLKRFREHKKEWKSKLEEIKLPVKKEKEIADEN